MCCYHFKLHVFWNLNYSAISFACSFETRNRNWLVSVWTNFSVKEHKLYRNGSQRFYDWQILVHQLKKKCHSGKFPREKFWLNKTIVVIFLVLFIQIIRVVLDKCSLMHSIENLLRLSHKCDFKTSVCRLISRSVDFWLKFLQTNIPCIEVCPLFCCHFREPSVSGLPFLQ